MASKVKPSGPDPVWQSWKVAVQFDVGDSVSPTSIKDTAEHAGICLICWTNVNIVFVLTNMHVCTESEKNCIAHPNWLLLQRQRPATTQTSQKTPSSRQMLTTISIKSSGHWDISESSAPSPFFYRGCTPSLESVKLPTTSNGLNLASLWKWEIKQLRNDLLLRIQGRVFLSFVLTWKLQIKTI